MTENAQYIPTEFVDSEDASGNVHPGDWRGIVQSEESALKPTRPGRLANDAKEICGVFKGYFNSKNGLLPWPDSQVNSC